MCKTPTWRSLGGVVGEMGMNLVEVPYVAIEKREGMEAGLGGRPGTAGCQSFI